MNIPMPSASEKRSSIEFIKTAGLKKKRTLLSVSAELFRDFGLKNTFFGISDCLYVALLCAVIAVCLVLAIETKFVYTLLMTVSPVIYIAVYLLSMWKDSMTDTLDVTRCCKYTYAQVTALRMLIFSLVSIAADIPLAAAGAISSGTSFWRLLLISFCALFIYSVLMIALLLKTPKPWVHSILPLVWMLVNLALYVLRPVQWEGVLQCMPPVLLAGLLAVFAVLYAKGLNAFIKRGEEIYADS